MLILILFIPEQFTVKAQPALFEGRRGEGEPKNETLLFQSTVDIHFQNAHKTFFQSIQLTYTFKTCTKHTQNCDDSHYVRLFIYFAQNIHQN